MEWGGGERGCKVQTSSEITSPFYVNSQAPVLVKFSLDGSDVNVGWWETDLPFVMT